MKKILIASLCLLFLCLCACGPEPSDEITGSTSSEEKASLENSTVEQAKTSETSELAGIINNKNNESNLYAETIRTIKKNFVSAPDQLNYLHYALYDIDENGTKELLIGESYTGEMRLNSICSIIDGVAVRQEEFRSFGEGGYARPSTLFENGTIRVDRVDDTIIFYYYYYRFENGELKHQIMLIDNTFFNENDYFSNKDPMKRTPITKAEFDRVKKEMEGDGQVVELDWKPLAEYGR